jgi:hypothetical protein
MEVKPMKRHCGEDVRLVRCPERSIGQAVGFSEPTGEVLRRGLIFRAGDYPNQRFSMNPRQLARVVDDFEPVPIDLGHPHAESPMDGHFGELRSVELSADGKDLYGTVALPRWLEDKLGDKRRLVSATFDRMTRKLKRLSLVTKPHISDAELMAAFSAAGSRRGRGGMAMAKKRAAGRTNREAIRATFREWLEDGDPEFNGSDEDHGEGTMGDRAGTLLRTQAVPIEETAEFKAAVKKKVAQALREGQEAMFSDQAQAWFTRELEARRVLPREKKKLLSRYVRCAVDDLESPAEFDDGSPLSRLAEFCGDIKNRKPHSLDHDEIGQDLGEGVENEPALPPNGRPLAHFSRPTDPRAPLSPGQLAGFLALTNPGKAAMAEFIRVQK